VYPICADGQDFAVNLLITSCGHSVPEDQADLYALSNLSSSAAGIFNGARGFTSLMSIARIRGELEVTMFEDLPIEAQQWIEPKGLGYTVPNIDPLDNSPYMRRIWSASQVESKRKREFNVKLQSPS